MSKLRITRLVEAWDMRKRHVLRKRYITLKAGEVLLAFNGTQTIARFIDAEGGSHDYYAPKGEMFDVKQLARMVRSGLGVELTVGQSERQKADYLRLDAA